MRIWPWLSRVSTAERVGEGSSPRYSCLAGFEQGEALRRVDAERLEHFGRQHFAHAALQRQPPVAAAAPRRLAAALGAEVEQAARARRGAARTGSRARRRCRDCRGGTGARDSAARAARQIAGQRLEPREMPLPIDLVQAPSRRLGPALVEEARDALRESRPARPRRRMPGPSSKDRNGCGASSARDRGGDDRGKRRWRVGPTVTGTAPKGSGSIIAIMTGRTTSRRSCAFPG